jgi:hypothetical protein
LTTQLHSDAHRSSAAPPAASMLIGFSRIRTLDGPGLSSRVEERATRTRRKGKIAICEVGATQREACDLLGA